MFKSRWQPLPAYVGIFGCAFVVIWSGIPPLYILGSKSGLTSTGDLKSNIGLGCDVLGAYSGPFLFAVCYLTYKYITPRSRAVQCIDLTPGDYVLGDLAVIEGEDPTADGHANGAVFNPDGTEMESQRWGTTPPNHVDTEFEMSDDQLDEYEAQKAHEQQRRGIEEVLGRRPRRIERNLLRELWSCVIADKSTSSEAD
ncbi:hypothetical protein SLS60_004706 [Paraconiothyrium brasiliense]|uniref:Uncharacterized protein n=1 Tax=Paraconiothyrium brasiliense TaxID=300254 RepID=A0ABR3RLL2_9PLEO